VLEPLVVGSQPGRDDYLVSLSKLDSKVIEIYLFLASGAYLGLRDKTLLRTAGFCLGWQRTHRSCYYFAEAEAGSSTNLGFTKPSLNSIG